MKIFRKLVKMIEKSKKIEISLIELQKYKLKID